MDPVDSLVLTAIVLQALDRDTPETAGVPVGAGPRSRMPLPEDTHSSTSEGG